MFFILLVLLEALPDSSKSLKPIPAFPFRSHNAIQQKYHFRFQISVLNLHYIFPPIFLSTILYLSAAADEKDQYTLFHEQDFDSSKNKL